MVIKTKKKKKNRLAFKSNECSFFAWINKRHKMVHAWLTSEMFNHIERTGQKAEEFAIKHLKGLYLFERILKWLREWVYPDRQSSSQSRRTSTIRTFFSTCKETDRRWVTEYTECSFQQHSTTHIVKRKTKTEHQQQQS